MPRGGNNNPTGKGGFQKGHNNPGGRSKKQRQIEQLAQDALEDGDKNLAIEGLKEIATDLEVAPKDRKAAWELLMAYGYGKPRQRIEHSGEDGGPAGLFVEFVKAGSEK